MLPLDLIRLASSRPCRWLFSGVIMTQILQSRLMLLPFLVQQSTFCVERLRWQDACNMSLALNRMLLHAACCCRQQRRIPLVQVQHAPLSASVTLESFACLTIWCSIRRSSRNWQTNWARTQMRCHCFPILWAVLCPRHRSWLCLGKLWHLICRASSQDALARITGHTFRITGARLLCSMGLDPVTVSIHGRWSSNAVLTYLAEAPLLSMKARLRPSVQASDRNSELNCNKRPVEQDESQDIGLEQRFKLAQHLEEQLQQRDVAEIEDGETGFVLNVVSSRVHIRKITDEQTHNWATKCGWKWAGKRHVHSSTTEPDFSRTTWKKCPKCFKGQMDEEGGSTSDSSSSSSSSD